jgi:hypothetical protein
MTGGRTTLVDTYPAFLAFWDRWRRAPLEAQIEAWRTDYLAPWPELVAKQQECYAREDIDWRQIARERIFSNLGDRLPAMEEAHRNLLDTARPVVAEAREALEFQFQITLVVYVGIGCGAGWATTYEGTPAVLFGLENIAECGWQQCAPLRGLIAHEIGHTVHEFRRTQQGLAKGEGPWWQLYEEGFAQRCEHLVLGQDTWHMRGVAEGTDWIHWCTEHRAWLAAEFLRCVEQGESVGPFFGSWYNLRGRSQCGYFLGHELLRLLEAECDFQELALLEDVQTALLKPLTDMAIGIL